MQKPMDEALERFMLSASLPILTEVDGVAHALGTGTLFKTANRFYLVTADHVVKAVRPETLASPMSFVDGKILTWGTVSLLNYKSEALDLVVIEFKSSELIDALTTSYMFLTVDQIGSPNAGGEHWVVGFPEALSKSDMDVVSQRPMAYRTTVLATPPRGARDVIPTDLFLAMAPQVERSDGSLIPTPRFGGMSGASIWEVADYQAGLWTPGKVARVIGVQTSARHGEYLRATRWEAVVPLLYALEMDSAEPGAAG